MIVSHSRKFIFIKTAKTAGTSLEIVLSKYCKDGDIITPLSPNEEKKRAELGGVAPQGYTTPARELSFSRQLRSLFQGRGYPKFTSHSPAWEIKKKLPREIWDSYYKFTVVRHPFDQVVSGYFWSVSVMEKEGRPKYFDWNDFDQYLRYHPEYLNYNWKFYTENDRPLVDFVVKYENMREDLRLLSKRLGLSHNIFDEMAATRMKSEFRPRDSDKDSLLTDKHKQLIRLLCEKEMKMFGYS